MQILIETERLLIRELLPTDAEGMFEMESDPIVHRYVGNKPITTIEESRAVIEFVRQQYADYGIGRWAVLEKATNDFVGWLGFKWMQGPVNGHTNFYDFGYRLTRKHWGKGYASEGSKAAMKYGQEQLGFKNIYAMTDVDNKASRRVLEKTGLQYVETFAYDAEPNWRGPGEPATWYKMTDNKYTAT